MQCKINDYELTDGTIAGGVAITGLRFRMERIFDTVVPLQSTTPFLLDRNKRRCTISFLVQRVHETIKAADEFILDHETTVPRTGDVQLIIQETVTGAEIVGLVVNGVLLSHELARQIGKFTEHNYEIIGSPVFAPTPGEDHLVTEGGDRITTEGGDEIVVE